LTVPRRTMAPARCALNTCGAYNTSTATPHAYWNIWRPMMTSITRRMAAVRRRRISPHSPVNDDLALPLETYRSCRSLGRRPRSPEGGSRRRHRPSWCAWIGDLFV
jgi:hypothetical protein